MTHKRSWLGSTRRAGSSNWLPLPACPPEDPIKYSFQHQDCTITNSCGACPDRSVCRAAEVAYPTTDEEIISVVATATMNKRKMKVATRFSHSIPKLVCPDSEDGLLISTKFLNRVLEIDRLSMTMRVESGVTLRQLIHEAAEAGMAFTLFTILVGLDHWWPNRNRCSRQHLVGSGVPFMTSGLFGEGFVVLWDVHGGGGGGGAEGWQHQRQCEQ
ncbi:D-arabinono-1,4-lactone oxidase family protein [Actinidia rufa]|uniref:D-arabinono-1,4-lactone oxidase family protein n=1 Tax=Actinidia rufa TaxID=165716 RepID=A0A7J0FI80_9ERIC|nr:D-arabinono-1,4-lactone oxidase family protein [Actinidia rufa]